uniref:Nei-like DNA glycosylase 1 n=1 Tax=Oncorhynchus kisutch TaxID=8019 RepID=A0A8C7GFL0_ONCKI
MPEGPELHLASLFVNRMCGGVVFTGPVQKSEVSKNPEVSFSCPAYTIIATSRGKEVRLTLTPQKSDSTMDIVFRFGMSGFFRFTTEAELPKHSHLRFYTNEKPCRVLSFVDTRRFGSWQPNGTWQLNRGPCIMFEYLSYRENVLSHLSDRAFDRPICEVLLNQKYFNGIGNYLRAEILFRLNIPPFVKARTVLEGLQTHLSDEDRKEQGYVLFICIVLLGGKGYDPEKMDYTDFKSWLQCYCVEGMKSVRDHNGRTMWFKGDPGPMAPKGEALAEPKTEENPSTIQQSLTLTPSYTTNVPFVP